MEKCKGSLYLHSKFWEISIIFFINLTYSTIEDLFKTDTMTLFSEYDWDAISTETIARRR